MRKDLLKITMTALVAVLFIGCGSSGKSTKTTAPTTAPTVAPTTAPTVAPTTAPTVAPTATPVNDTSDPLPF